MGSVVKNHPIRRIATTQHDKTSLMRGIYLAGMAAALAFQGFKVEFYALYRKQKIVEHGISVCGATSPDFFVVL